MAACVGALLFWSMVFAAASGLVVAGLTVSALEAGVLSALMIGVTGTMAGVAGSLWQLPDSPRRPAVGQGTNRRRAIEVGMNR